MRSNIRRAGFIAGNSPDVAERAWNRLASEQYVDQSLLRQEIALSWERCLQNNVDPLKARDIKILDDVVERAELHWKLLKVAKSHMQDLYEAVKGMGFIVILTNAEGVILDIFGDRKMYSMSESVSLVHGASCSEEAIGTTSPGVCLARKSPVQVFSREHYCRLYHDWCCSAAPIFDSQGKLAATLDLSNNDEKKHTPLLLSLVGATAKAIAMELNFRKMQDDFKKSYHYFNMIVDSVPEALVFFDRRGTLTRMNKTAAKMLGIAPTACSNGQVQAVVNDFESLAEKLGKGQGWAELMVKTPRGPIRVDAFLKFIQDDASKNVGVVGTLKEAKSPSIEGNTAVYSFQDLVFRSRKMEEMVLDAKDISTGDATVLIQGESGTGKELLAQAIHNHSPRRRNPFVAVNCAALPKDLIQSELFGYEEGAFTGAKRGGKPGRFELANGGSIFLDEIGDMPISVQANLLRVLQEKQVVRVGGFRPIRLDVRVIAASNKDLSAEVEAGGFRRDLFYRLSVMSVHIPPLRERKADIDVLVRHFVQKHTPPHMDADAVRISPQVARAFAMHDWPGNARELENTVIFFMNKVKGDTVTAKDLPPAFGHYEQNSQVQLRTLDEAEKQTIVETLTHCNNNVSLTAGILGVTRATLYHKVAKYMIQLRK